MTSPHIPIETVVSIPQPGTALPTSIKFSPDQNWLTYLDSADDSLQKQLYRCHLENNTVELLVDAAKTGITEENLSLEEALRRERARQRTVGVTEYRFNAAGQILIPLPSGLFILDAPGRPLRLLVSSEAGALQNGRFSPNGQWVAYVQNNEIYVVETAGGLPTQLTFGAAASGKSNGVAEYIAQEEMERSEGFWWSPDSTALAFVEVDETHIPVFRIMHLGKDEVGERAQEDHRYPFAGHTNARVRLGVLRLDAPTPVWMDLGDDDDFYLARVKWAGNRRLLAQRLNREQSELDLLSLDPTSGSSTLLLREKSDVWINLHKLLRVVKPCESLPDGGFIWGSERSQFQHLYLYDWNGDEVRPLTSGNWMVESIISVDRNRNKIFFMATKESVLEKHLYVTDLNGSEPKRLTQQPGMHHCIYSQARHQFVDVFSNWETPLNARLVDVETGSSEPLFAASAEGISALNLCKPRHVTLRASSGEPLHGLIYRPPDRFGQGPFPTVVSVYGGPHAQRVTNSWTSTVDMRAQFLAQHGFLVFKLDNRGSSRRGLAFEGHIKHSMGDVEVADQVAGVGWLIEQGLTTPHRVGVYGWSYGGYMALLCLAKAGDMFGTAVAGAPVTDWDGYDTCYTERYMGLPQSNPSAYKTSSVMHYVENISGNLLLVHGLIDENVHFRHTARLINALTKSRKPYDLLLFPNERHVPRGLADRIYMEEQIRDYFLKHL